MGFHAQISILSRVWSLLPVRCLLCSQWDAQRLCAACLRDAAPGPTAEHRPRCRGCGLRLAVGVVTCADCSRDPPPHGAVTVAVDYAPPWDRLLLRYKFSDHPEWAGALALLLARALDGAERRETRDAPVRVVPIPLSPERLSQRGYNQAWAVARRLARSLRLPARADVLLRPVDLPGQAEQGRQDRLKRLRGVFQVNPRGRPWVAGQTVALVDDVLTTGATVREAARTLQAAGAREVLVWAVARTPPVVDGPS